MLNESAIYDALRSVQEPVLGRDIVTLNMVKDVAIENDAVSLKIELTTPACPLKDEIMASQEEKFRYLFEQLRVSGTRAHVERHVPLRPNLRPAPDNLLAAARS